MPFTICVKDDARIGGLDMAQRGGQRCGAFVDHGHKITADCGWTLFHQMAMDAAARGACPLFRIRDNAFKIAGQGITVLGRGDLLFGHARTGCVGLWAIGE